MQQSIQRIDHIVIIVKEETAHPLADLLGRVLGIPWNEPQVNEATGALIIVSWDAGLEIIAPIREEGPYWERIQRFGEGSVSIVFGVPDLDKGMERAKANGLDIAFLAQLNGDEPWLSRFSKFREARLASLGENLSLSFSLSEIVPAETFSE